ncbi:bifunctional folylpolyglutamate synthase/dihydrofolate synthase [Sphingomonas sp.]|uniref:bifunctional folylpolyglutamate synthase/dihydrofolate synthase n=1 Tax=Sphingomonas sp. TaxID=28214 RepID=UPI0035C872A0
MPDHAVSAHPGVQAQLDRLWSLSPGADVLGLERITRLLARLGDPHHHLAPVFHVAGTNGKGSTCAFLRAMLEAAGHRVHVYTSPHLVRFNERIRLAGTLIDDDALAALLSEVLDAGGDLGASFFEVTTAAAFLAFSRVPADACVIEVGLGGRLDATNVLASPVACGIAALGIDHEAFLLAEEAGTPKAPLDRIGFEKAGIAKPGVPLVIQAYPPSVIATIEAVAAEREAPIVARGSDWDVAGSGDILVYTDANGRLDLPLPRLPGAHQTANAGLAVAILRRQEVLRIPEAAFAEGMTSAAWPARLQRLSPGPLTVPLPPGVAVWLDGGHNPSAGEAIAHALPHIAGERLAVVLGMLANKDAAGFLAPFAGSIKTLIAVPVSSHVYHAPQSLAELASSLGVARTGEADAFDTALADLARAEEPPSTVLIAGSLYLAGEVLRANDEPPD